MPRVRRRMLVRLDASPDDVRAAAIAALGLSPLPPSGPAEPGREPIRLRGRLEVQIATDASLTMAIEPHEPPGSEVQLEAETVLPVAYFRWFFLPVIAVLTRKALRHAAASLEAHLRGVAAPPPPRRSPITPAVPFSPTQAVLLSAVAWTTALASFGGGLFGQNAAFIEDAFGASDQALGVSLAITRVGILVAILAAAFADRRGRRRILLGALAGIAVANAVSAAAPNLAVFTAAQVVTRGLVNAAIPVAAIAAVEEAPDRARAFSVGMISLAGGAGFAVTVLLLPIGDLGVEAWRVSFALSAVTLLFLPRLSRVLTETTRYRTLPLAPNERGRPREVGEGPFGRRIVVLAAFTFLAQVMAAPSSQLINVYLDDERGFSGASITLFRGITQGLPALIGVLIGARLAESRGRKPLLVIGLTVATLVTMAFYLSDGIALWATSALGVMVVGAYGPAQGAFSTELFPTEVRGTSSAMLLVCGVAGSVVGLILAGSLSDPLDGIGRAIALLGVAPLLAALVLVPALPEAAWKGLDDLSPSRAPRRS